MRAPLQFTWLLSMALFASAARAGNEVDGLVLPAGEIVCHHDISARPQSFGFVLLADGRHTLWAQGEPRDWRLGRRQAERVDGDLLVFRSGEDAWLVRNTRAIAAASALVRSREEFAREDGRLSDLAARLEDEGARLSDEGARLSDQQAALTDRRAELADRRLEAHADARALAGETVRLDGRQAQLDARRKDLERRRAILSERRRDLALDRERYARRGEHWMDDLRDALQRIATSSVRSGQALRLVF